MVAIELVVLSLVGILVGSYWSFLAGKFVRKRSKKVRARSAAGLNVASWSLIYFSSFSSTFT